MRLVARLVLEWVWFRRGVGDREIGREVLDAVRIDPCLQRKGGSRHAGEEVMCDHRQVCIQPVVSEEVADPTGVVAFVGIPVGSERALEW